MIQIVPRHGFDQRAKRHRAAFRVGDLPFEGFGRLPGDELHIPAPQGSESLERARQIVGPVGCRPCILIERLYGMVRLR